MTTPNQPAAAKCAPLAIDLFCGLGGWTEGLLSEGWDVVGFDIERHAYGEHRYPAQLVLQDVRLIDGARFRNASLIVASSPCQEFSYRAMPWKRAKALGPPLVGMELFAQAERIQREAIAAAGRFIPMVQENVRGAQKYVGRARWHYGSFYLWGDVPALMPITFGRGVMKAGVAHRANGETNFHASAKRVLDDIRAGKRRQIEGIYDEGKVIKNVGGSWFNVAHNTESGTGRNPVHEGVKHSAPGQRENGKGSAWFGTGPAAAGSKSNARKAVSARIAKIPIELSSHIARAWKPRAIQEISA